MQGASGIILLVVMIVVMYFLLIRPQRKREKETNAMRSSVKVGDQIVTIGGICGKVVKTKEESLVIQVGAGHDRTRFEVMRWSISKIVSAEEAKSKEKEEYIEEDTPKKKAVPRRMKKSAPAEDADDEFEDDPDSEPETSEDTADTADEKTAEVDEDENKKAEESEDEK